MAVPDIFPIPFLELMLLNMSDLTEANPHSSCELNF